MKKFVSIMLLFIVQLAGIGALSAMQPSSSTVVSSGTASATSSSKVMSTATTVTSPIKTDDKKESKEEKKLAQQSRVAHQKVKPMAVDLPIDESKMSADQLYDRGRCYQFGIGVEQDVQMATQWFEKSADGGSALAMCRLGENAVCGTGMPVDEFAAGQWFAKSAEKGNAGALRYLGKCLLFGFCEYAIDAKKAIACFEKAVDNGDSEALVYLSHCYQYGLGVKKNENKAVEYRDRAIKKRGKAAVQETLTELVTKKLGFEKEAIYSCPRTCRKATNQQNAACPICLGELYSGMRIQRCNNGHGYHAVCMERWKDSKGFLQCPYCRSSHIADGNVAGEGDVVDNKTGYGTGLGCVIS